MSEKVYVGSKAAALKQGREYEPFSRVTMWSDDENYYTAGDDTGRELSIECPWATQKIVDNVLRQVKGYVYRPYEAEGTALDMAAELGDGITVGGLYSVIAQTTERFDAMGAADVSAPGEREVDHEFPYQSAQEREMKRRVKLGQKYHGVSITRKEGLTIVETDGEREGAKVVLNSKELSFYDGGGARALFFDPGSGTYKFMGELNVADRFKVDKNGNVVMKGSINLSDGNITWGGKGPVRYQFSTDGANWHDAMAANDKYRRDSLDGGTTWGDAYQFRGEDGRDGSDGSDGRPGSDADVPDWVKAYTKTATYIDNQWVIAPNIAGGVITALEKMEAACDFYVGDNIFVGKSGDGGLKMIRFHDTATIASPSWGNLAISAISLDLSKIDTIVWGGNAPVAVFG